MLITGAHSIIYSRKPEQDRAFIRDVLQLPFVDSGGGWLIFALPPSEVAVHPSSKSSVEEFYLLCDDIDALVRRMSSLKIRTGKITRQPWGLLTRLKLPGGGSLKIYQPLHERPKPVRGRSAGTRKARPTRLQEG